MQVHVTSSLPPISTVAKSEVQHATARDRHRPTRTFANLTRRTRLRGRRLGSSLSMCASSMRFTLELPLSTSVPLERPKRSCDKSRGSGDKVAQWHAQVRAHAAATTSTLL